MDFITGEKFVVIDIETTGNRVKLGDEVIQIGICLIDEGHISETYSTYVKPSIEIPTFIEQLTGITNQDVEQAPSLEEVLPEILKRINCRILVAHNALFDVGVLQYILNEHGYSPFTGYVMDTVELSRILLPTRSGYKLNQLAEEFELNHENPHRADSDAYATAQLFLALCEKLWTIPLVTIQRMIPLSRSLHSDIEVLFRRIEQDKLVQPYQEQVFQKQHDIYRHVALRQVLSDIEQEEEEVIPPFHEEQIEQVLGFMMPDYEKRQGQIELATMIYNTFTQEQHGLFEAATGTGKTLAYLMAALFWAKEQQEQVVISTHTIQLQEQIKEKELPKLAKALPFQFQSALLKGRHHYLCLRKFENQLFRSEDKNYDYDLAKLQMLVWLSETETGDVEELNLPSGGRELWHKVQSETATCINHQCPWFERCFYFRAKKEAQKAELIITNHSLLLSDLETNRIIPKYQYLIMDESHHLEQIVTDQYTQSVSYMHLSFLIQRLTSIDKVNLSEQLIRALELVIEEQEWAQGVKGIEQQFQELKVELDRLFTALVTFAEQKQRSTSESSKKVRIRHQQEQGEEWIQILQTVDSIASLMDRTMSTFGRVLLYIEGYEKEVSAAERGAIVDWKSAVLQVEEQIHLLYRLLSESDEGYVYWIEYEPKGAKNLATIKQAPLEIASYLRDQLFEQKRSVILTSATLQINQSYQYFIDQLGIPKDKLMVQTFESAFDYEQQAALLISNDISLIQEVNEETFAAELAYFILDVVKISQGRTMVLFTSHHMLRNTHSNLKQLLQEEGISLYAQGIDSGSRSKLTKNFQNQEKAILLGTSSFWEGVDIPGKQLSCLIIVKLPFTPPHTPYFEAKSEQLIEEGKNPFMDYALPQAVIRFKQGFGRLIRKSSDKGVVVVFDRRIIEKRYGHSFIRSLPKLTIKSVNKEELTREIQQWLG